MTIRWLVIVPVTIAIALACAFAAQRRMDAMRAATFDEQLLYLPNEKLLTHFTAGLSSVVGDVLWLKCIQYTSKHFKSDHKFVWLGHMCETITRLDPYFVGVYRYGGVFLAALKADDDASIRLLRSGIAHNPDRWELPYEAAMVYLLNRREQPDSPARAAQYLAMAVATGTAPESVLNVARGLQMKHDLLAIERTMWRDVLETSDDQFMRDLAAQKLLHVDLREACAAMNRCIDAYSATHGAPPERIDDLAADGLISRVPQDPLGGTFFVDDEGRAQSTTLLNDLMEHRLSRIRGAVDAFKSQRGRFPEALKELVEGETLPSLPPHPYGGREWRYDRVTGRVY